MAHNLATTDGKTAMFYCGEKPWHGLGTELDGPATAADAIKAAGLDWDVDMAPIQTTAGIEVPMGRAAIRRDTQGVLGLVGTQWTPIQNRECFGFLDGLVDDGGLRYHTAGALGRGERVWMLAKLPGDLRIEGTDDVSEKYLLLSNAHDGRSSLRVFFTPIRVVCQNTLNAAERATQRQGVSIRHTGSVHDKIAEARRVLGFADRFYTRFGEDANRMAKVTLNTAQVRSYFEAVIPGPEDPEKSPRAQKSAQENWDALEHLFVNGKGQDLPGVKRTLWAAYNAVTEWVDHKPLKDAGALEDRREARLVSNWFGTGATVKGRAFEAAMAMAN